MSGHLDDNEERRLREILHAEVDHVHPSGDGLQRIQERTARRGMAAWMAWLRPAAAVAGALAIVATVLFGAPALREQIAPATNGEDAGPVITENETTTDDDPPAGHDPTQNGEATDTPGRDTDEPSPAQEPTTPAEEGDETEPDPTLLEDCPVPGDDPTLAMSPEERADSDEDIPDHCFDDTDDDNETQDVDPTRESPILPGEE